MKLNYLQLDPHLRKSLSPIYIVSGEEPWLKQDAISSIQKKAVATGFDERIRLQADTHFDWQELYNLLYSTSFFANKRLIELDIRTSLPNKIGSELLQEYANKTSDHHLLLIEVGKLDNKITASAWYKALEKKSTIVTIWPIPRRDLPKWIQAQAKKYHLTFQQDAVQLLADYVDGNLTAAAQAIEKLSLLDIHAAIDAPLIKTMLINQSHHTIFDFAEQVIAGNVQKSLAILQNLKAEGTEPILILFALTREIRLLATLLKESQQGISKENLLQKHRIFFGRAESMRRFLNSFSIKNCHEFLLHTAEIDKIAKGVLPGNPWNNLELFCLRLALA